MDLLEKVQHRATKIIEGTSGMTYDDRLKKLNMYTLHERRLRGDLIQLFKFITQGETRGLEFTTDNRTRSNGCKLFKSQFNKEVRKHYFYNRVIDAWNELPANVVNSESVMSFKKKIDIHWEIVNSRESVYTG